MGNFKKIIVALLICSATFSILYSQNVNQTSTQVTEESIILSDDNTSNSNSSNITNEQKRNPSSVGSFIRMIVSLLFIIGLIVGIFWFLRRKSNVVKNEDDYLRRAAYINIAPTKTIEVITLIDKAYLIGVTEDNITLLGEIEDKELIQAMNLNADKKAKISKPLNFTQVLDTFLIKGKNKNFFSTESSTEISNDTSTENSSENSNEE